MSQYTAKTGDTFERIASQQYGTPQRAGLLQQANPQAVTTRGVLTAGTVITIPADPLLPVNQFRVAADRENEVGVTIAGQPFRFFTGMSLQRSVDGFDRFSMRGPFQSDVPEFREIFKPLSFQPATVTIGGVVEYTGINVDNPPSATPDGFTFTSSGYARAGVLNDCPVSGTSPLEYLFAGLREIATDQAAPFGLVPQFLADPGPFFDQVAIGVSDKILGFWIKLATQRGLIISNDELGNPLFLQETSIPSVRRLVMGSSPVQAVTPRLAPQKYYSHVTAVSPAFIGVDAAQFTVANPFLTGVVRPLKFDAGDAFPAEALIAANAKMGRMFANAVAWEVDVVGWRTVDGDLWRPNTRVRLLAPQAMVYRETEMLIRTVTLTRDAKKDTATLLLVLPGGFSGKVPESLPWLE